MPKSSFGRLQKDDVWLRACWPGTTAGGAARPWKGLKMPKRVSEAYRKRSVDLARNRCEAVEGFEGAKKGFRKPTERLCPANLLVWHDGWRRREGLEGFEGAKKQVRKPTETVCLRACWAGTTVGALRGFGRV